jgi:hypothetical protein
MAEITEDYGTGGAGLVPKNGSRKPPLATILRDIADDLEALNGGIDGTAITAEITAAALAAFTDPPTAGEMAAVRTLVNQLRTAVIEIIGVLEAGAGGGEVTLKTTKG